MDRNRHHTSFAATLATAAELERRCYNVAITFGNTPQFDLLATTEAGKSFTIQVKGISERWALRIQKSLFNKDVIANYFLIIVIVPQKDKDDHFQFFILTHDEAIKAYNAQRKTKKDGTKLKEGNEGLGVGDYKAHKNRWDKLPSNSTAS